MNQNLSGGQPTSGLPFIHGLGRLCYYSSMLNPDVMQRESNLINQIRERLPEFANACASEVEVLLIHQDAFAADYQEDEFLLLGMAIKYAGLCGKIVHVIGKNGQTVSGDAKIQ